MLLLIMFFSKAFNGMYAWINYLSNKYKNIYGSKSTKFIIYFLIFDYQLIKLKSYNNLNWIELINKVFIYIL